MFVSTKSHGEKIYHNQNCTYAKRIKEPNVVFIKSADEASHKGYRACNGCFFMGKQFKREERDIRKFAKSNGMKIWLYDNEVYIKNSAAAWKIANNSKAKQSDIS